MSVVRINEFRAFLGSGDTLRNRIRSFVPLIESSDGCVSCQLLQSQEDPTRILVIEVWESVERHRASLKNIPPVTFQETMKLLASPPKGEYFNI